MPSIDLAVAEGVGVLPEPSDPAPGRSGRCRCMCMYVLKYVWQLFSQVAACKLV